MQKSVALYEKSEWDGSTYKGIIQNKWPQGHGEYTFSNGIIFIGEFSNGLFHGNGLLIFPDGGKYACKWVYGKLSGRGIYTFHDGLVYGSEEWDYLSSKDRRFKNEASKQHTNKHIKESHTLIEAAQGMFTCPGTTLFRSSLSLPVANFDIAFIDFLTTGKGFYNASTSLTVHLPSQRIVRIPHEMERDWIIKHCELGS
ncbi:hypothetical protein IE077_001073 [Cardiosporidium cionae]|uniref:MORN repeat-containing protein 5 n=1 Tax=Cardiosporidium cionae TaxID=476202 RepID=A0ABQ7JDH7_9APIC|nr:hypothetical protein IE077_001073 [Cardiosporidium cionae]|eukprot:KAF8822083.1 hypothetical protein IE077_001073 [Cardiosporidium cionae]